MAGFFLSDMNPVHIVSRKGDIDDPYVSIEETIKIGNTGKVLLKEIPSELEKVVAKDSTNTQLNEIQKDKNIAINEFHVDYKLGIVSSHNDLIGTSITFTYKGTGVVSIGASRVYVEDDGANPTKTLETLITEANQALADSKEHADLHKNDTKIHRTITSGTANPTGGVDGDIYFQYE